MRSVPSQFARISLIGVLALMTVSSCKRESRSFRMPAAAVQMTENVESENPVRPGPGSDGIESTQQPASGQINEPYGKNFPNNAQALSDGQQLYESFNCVGCHAHGGGGIGPPLLDNKWFYGSDPSQVYQSILNGRPNGMPSFRGRLPDFQIWEIVAYVRSLSGQANSNAAAGREDHMRTGLPPNSTSKEKPETVPAPTTGPVGGDVKKAGNEPSGKDPATTTPAETTPEKGAP